MKKHAEFSARYRGRKKMREKKSDDLLKLHLTPSSEKHIPNAVINIYLHDFAQQVRFEEGVILHGN
jgi:hypothetical protein